MKEMLKSKGIIVFVALFIGITYINAIGTARMEENYKVKDNYVAVNTI